MTYTKLAGSILTSTIWMEDDKTRIVWLTLMAMADKNGEVQASIPGLANVARVPVAECREAIAKFLAPDPDSRTRTDEGRRIEEIKGGWMLINHADYRQLASDDDRKQKAAIRQQRVRDRAAASKIVTLSSRQISQAEADPKAKEEKKETPPASRPPKGARKCPETFTVTPDLIDWATENAPGVSVDVETAKLRDHTFRNAISDWPGAWRNWMRRASEATPVRRPVAAPAMTFAERDSANRRARIREMTGGLMGQEPGSAQDFIDMEVDNDTRKLLG